MAYQEVLRVDISEVIRRWQAGNSRRHIASGTGLSKDTVGKYIAAAEARWGYLATVLVLARSSSAAWLPSAAPVRGRRRCPPRRSWPPGPTRSTSGSLGTGCN